MIVDDKNMPFRKEYTEIRLQSGVTTTLKPHEAAGLNMTMEAGSDTLPRRILVATESNGIPHEVSSQLSNMLNSEARHLLRFGSTPDEQTKLAGKIREFVSAKPEYSDLIQLPDNKDNNNQVRVDNRRELLKRLFPKLDTPDDDTESNKLYEFTSLFLDQVGAVNTAKVLELFAQI